MLYSPLYVKMSPTPENSDAHMVNDTHPDLASSKHFDSACQDSMTQYQSRAKWPLGFCISLNKSHFGKDTDAVHYPGVWIKWFQTHPWLPSAQWVMLVNSAIRCIVNSCYLSVYSSWVWWQRLPSCQVLAPSPEHFISQRNDSFIQNSASVW